MRIALVFVCILGAVIATAASGPVTAQSAIIAPLPNP